jgi:two-component system sensor histidine kinase VicK
LLQANRIHLLNKENETRVKVKVQRDMIERVMQNLLSNAVRYVPEEGNIAIEFEADEKSKLVTLSISDNGCGIPKEDCLKTFDKYATVEAKNKRMSGSTGLGLTFCKFAVELPGGRYG